jgi:hypothetical protein
MGYLQIELGSVKRGLKFDIGTLKCLQDLYSVDPFNFQTESTSMSDLLPYATKIVHAGLVRNSNIKKEAVDITIDQIDEWVSELDLPTLTDIVTAYNEVFTRKVPSANGEVGKDTQPVILQ